eukprot:CAMPEP_0170180888 /NCGR_PEP_ID=MMETSP0040_2-20121228/23307_1 /TAXON_ID=641309 /ORGANISM="Lotharella oceanica, Strain CCMP622" /LENGTH=228 /DNA_ID=CAMNT_0010425685 /DNA_START=95 /DNA_END=782 /DNA_ORIENTATION=-
MMPATSTCIGPRQQRVGPDGPWSRKLNGVIDEALRQEPPSSTAALLASLPQEPLDGLSHSHPRLADCNDAKPTLHGALDSVAAAETRVRGDQAQNLQRGAVFAREEEWAIPRQRLRHVELEGPPAANALPLLVVDIVRVFGEQAVVRVSFRGREHEQADEPGQDVDPPYVALHLLQLKPLKAVLGQIPESRHRGEHGDTLRSKPLPPPHPGTELLDLVLEILLLRMER